jgi:uncharacterized protein YraI
MNITKTTITGLLAAVGLFAASAAAFATPATATSGVNVRSGPGTSYGIVDTLTPGENVEVTECASNGWCHIQHPGPDGWVSSNYLTAGTSGGGSSSSKPDCDFGMAIGPHGPTFAINCGDGPGVTIAPPAPPAPTVDKVCFYKNKNYNGAVFCVSPGSKDNKLPANWNNKISSIKVIGSTSVKVCRNQNYGGGCKTYGHSKKKLPPLYNNKVTSFKTY